MQTVEERRVKDAANHRKYYAANRDKIDRKHKLYDLSHPEMLRATKKRYRVTHKEEEVVRGAAYRATHKEEERERVRIWHAEHPEICHAREKKWRQDNPSKKAVAGYKSHAKRRVLGFAPINESFVGCEAHHVDHDHVLYIPSELHKSVSHNIWTGKNMEQINALAFQYLNEGA